jgi:poly-gamma-glutamate synthesis protein (capsule biosynthesis protein)
MKMLLVAMTAVLAAAVGARAAEPAPATVRDGFTFAAVGDLIGPEHPILKRQDPGTLRVQRLLSAADVAFGNQEGAIFDLADFPGYPAAQNGGGTPINDAVVAFDLKALGLKMLSQANNHATDFGVEGMAATSRSLDAAGIAHAGTGPSLAAARAPAYVKTPKGVVGLVAAAGTFTDLSVAADPRGDFRARPGLSPLRTRAVQLVTEPQMATLREIAKAQLAPDARENPEVVSDARTAQELTLGRTTFRAAAAPGLTYELNGEDRAQALASVKQASANADLVVFSIHAHETASADPEDVRPADYLPPLFHELIDAGADVIVRHGPHALLGVEIYKGRPIFYGMGSFMFQVGDRNRQFRGMTLPQSWYDGAVAVTEFRDGRAALIRIHPFVQNLDSDALQGTPKTPSHAEAQRILRRIQGASTQFGTKVEIQGDVGIIRVAADTAG